MFVFIFPLSATAQTAINGSVKNRNGEPLVANVLVQAKGSATVAAFTVSNAEGNYALTYRGESDSITVSVTGMNVGRHSRTVANQSGRVDFEIEEKPLDLTGVTISAPKIRQTGDTISYSVDAYVDQSDRVIGDVLKKLPGIEVTSVGRISYQGREINKFYIEGMDLLQGRYGIAVNNIAAKDVASVEVLENHQPIKALLKRAFSDRAAINLKLRESARGTLVVTGMAGAGYQPMMWNAELIAMYFGKTMQHITTYKSNNSGKDISPEFRTNYDYERIFVGSGSPLYVQSPGTPPIPQKRYLYNNSHAATVNQLVKLGKDREFKANALYYRDRIEKNGYSLYEQYLPGDSMFFIEERVNTLSKIHNAELALCFNTNADNYYLNNALNMRGSWNDDTGTGITRNNADNLDKSLSQWLNKPSFAFDNTLDIIKNVKNNSYKIYFSTGYGEKAHTLTVAPADYFGDNEASSLTQDVFLRDFASILRVSYGLKLGNFNLDYSVWGRADVQKMDTELHVDDKNGNRQAVIADSLKNDLWYNNYQTGIHQSYTYNKNKLRLLLNFPLTYEIKTADDRIPERFSRNIGLVVNPYLSARYEINHELVLSTSSNFRRSFGDMNSNYTGLIMHGYRSLQRNTIDRLFEIRSADANVSVSYRNVFEALFISGSINYNYLWQNLLYGYDYHGIMSLKNTMDQPAASDGYGVNFNGNKGLDFWRVTVRLSGGYNRSRGKQLVQGEILNSRSSGYKAGAGMNMIPLKFLSVDYSFSWNRNIHYAKEQAKRFTPITAVLQDAKINLFPFKTLTVNIGVEHRYNSAASSPHTTFADAGIKFKRNKLDMELEVNNIFNAKQYVSASQNDVSAYYTSYELRPISVLLCVRLKLK